MILFSQQIKVSLLLI